MKEKVLITGASGFIGFHIIEAALAMNLEVFAAVRKSSDIAHLQSLQNVHFVHPDFSCVDKLKKDLEVNQYQYIIHAAGLTKARTQNEYNYVNVDYTFNLMRAAATANIPLKKIVFYSSLAAIGPLHNATDIITENTTPNPATKYGKSKLLAEQKIAGINIPLITLRPTAVYGPRERDIFIMLQSFKRGLEPYIGKIDQQLSFVYAKDLAMLSVRALFSEAKNITCNITDGNVYGRYDLADLSKLCLNKKTFKFHIPASVVSVIAQTLETTYGWFGKMPTLYPERLNELMAINWNCSIDKARTELNYTPEYNLQQGLTETIDWYKKERWM